MSSEKPEVKNEKTTEKTANVASSIATKRKQKISAVAVGSLLLLMVGMAGGIALNQAMQPTATPSFTARSDGNTTATKEEQSIASIAEKVGPSVVSIVTETRSESFFGTSSGQAAGTGIIVSKNGYVMTNNHVLANATKAAVIDSDGTRYNDVTVIGRDPSNDVAFLKINADTSFTAAELGNSSSVRIGQQVVAIGNALGQYSNTVTSGIISGTGRPITASSGSGSAESLTDLLQTDASINPGNSGGPLVNMAGQIIGINTAIVEDANGIGFAIPVNATKGILAGVLENGKVSRAFLGVSYLTVTPEVAREYNLSAKTGAYIHGGNGANPIPAGSPAEKAGLKEYDIITKINNEAVGVAGGLSSILGEYRPGDKVSVTYLRDGKEATTTVTLGTYKAS